MYTPGKKYSILAIPFLIIGWGVFNLLFFDAYYSRSVDPEMPYLINGLNMALLKFNRIGHIDHPGTPFQLFIGIVIRFTHLITGKGSLAHDVFSRPEHYLNAINIVLIALQSLLTYFIGYIGIKRNLKTAPILMLQGGVLLSNLMFWLFCRVVPERWFVITILFFTLIYLYHGYQNRNPLKFAIWSGVVMAMGFATKFNFLPILLLPILLINTNKNRLIYAGAGVVSFFVFVSPIIDKFDDYRRFVTSIAQHDGIYGQGEAKIFNIEKIQEGLNQLFTVFPELALWIALVFLALGIAILKRKNKNMQRQILLFAGLLLIIAIQMLMVAKHFKNAYMVPALSISGLILFFLQDFNKEVLKDKKWSATPISALFAVFAVFALAQTLAEIKPIKLLIEQRESIRKSVQQYVNSTDFWFVEPTWESGPYVENGLIYGLSYCGHRDDYANDLIQINPNIITYEGNTEYVNLWRCFQVPLDSVVATGRPILVYSTPARNATVLLQMLRNAAEKQNLELATDTAFSDAQSGTFLIRSKAIDTFSDWKAKPASQNTYEERIAHYVDAIRKSPEWLESVTKKAEERKISLDSMILLDAKWMADQE